MDGSASSDLNGSGFQFKDRLELARLPDCWIRTSSSMVVGSKVHLVPRDSVVVEMAKRPCPRWLGRAVVVEILDHPVEKRESVRFLGRKT